MELADLGNGYGLAEIGPATKATQAAKSGGEKDYGRSIRAAARGLVSGIFDGFQFLDIMLSSLRRSLTRAFYEGMKQAGIAKPKAVLDTPAFLPERIALDSLIHTNEAALFGFLSYLIKLRDNLYTQGQKQIALNRAFNRALLWSNQYDKARQLAFTMVSGDVLITWHLGKTEEHCDSCLKFDGRTYRASTWAKYNAIPKSPRLCCGGHHCDCENLPAVPGTRITPGRFPEGALCN